MLLAIDTSGPLCSAAVYDLQQSALVTSQSDDIGRGHAEHLVPLLDSVLSKSNIGWKDISAVASVTGPGSFTGLRVGMAFAKGLEIALEIPAFGVTAFQAFAYGFPMDGELAVVLDAKRSEVWVQIFGDKGTCLTAPAALPVSEAVEHIKSKSDIDSVHLVGSGSNLIIAEAHGSFDRLQKRVLSTAASPPIEAVAELAGKLKSTEELPLRPIYLRAPDAKPQSIGAAS